MKVVAALQPTEKFFGNRPEIDVAEGTNMKNTWIAQR